MDQFKGKTIKKAEMVETTSGTQLKLTFEDGTDVTVKPYQHDSVDELTLILEVPVEWLE